MKKGWITMTLMLGLAAGAAMAQRPVVRMEVPFAFTAGDASYPAGWYLVKPADYYGSVIIQSVNGNAIGFVTGHADGVEKRGAERTSLTFVDYGGHYFLKRVDIFGGPQRLIVPESPSEREAKAVLSKESNEVVVAAATKKP
jgi:hypothetical protein